MGGLNPLSLHISAIETLGAHTEPWASTESRFAFLDMPDIHRDSNHTST